MNAPARIITTPEKARLRVEDFLLLDKSGAFADYTKAELIDGEIYVMNAQYRPHARAKASIARALEAALAGSQWTVLTEVTVNATGSDAPEPDIVVTNEPDGDGPVPAASVGLVVEICDTTHATDLKIKPRRYAAAGIPEYWVVDLTAREIIQHSAQGMEGYRKIEPVKFGDPIVGLSMPGLEISSKGLD